MSESEANAPFSIQAEVRGPWRRYLDAYAPLRPALYRYCHRLTGNVWDGEDLMQDTLLRVFGYLGKIDRDLENPKAFFLRTATHLWIDQQRRQARDRAFRAVQDAPSDSGADAAERDLALHEAARSLLHGLAPRERAAVVLRDVLDLSADDTAVLLQTSVGAVKSALHRGRARLDEPATPNAPAPSPALVDRFTAALAANDLATLETICSADLTVELVGGARGDGFIDNENFFKHAHMVFPPAMAALARAMVLGTDPHWRAVDYHGERIVLGFRTFDGVVGLNEVHRIEEVDGRIARIRCYCFCPDTLAAIGEELGIVAFRKPYRSPDLRPSQ